MKIQPLISVVLPVYNVEKYIGEAMDSILNQTIQDFEILVIDDCSTDNTFLIAEAYNDNRIKIIRKERNRGLIHSLNLGFSIAKGKYIARMDGDDISHPFRFEKQLSVLDNYQDISICGCWLQCFGFSDKIIKRKKIHSEIVAALLEHCSMSLGTVMMRNELLNNYPFVESMVHIEDYDFWSRVCWDKKMHNIQEVLYYYRVHNKQVSKLYNGIQKKGDVVIKLFLFKKLTYCTEQYSDKFIEKMLLLNSTITIDDLFCFLQWLKVLSELNKIDKVYSQKELDHTLKRIKQNLLKELYFDVSSIGINRKWRLKAFFVIKFMDVIWILNLKKKEVLNIWTKKLKIIKQ